MYETLTRVSSVNRRFSLFVAVLALFLVRSALCQETDVDPDRVFTTDLRWERVAGALHSEKLRYAHGTLVILYLDGVYAELKASFIKTSGKSPFGLNLNDGYIVRLGTWSRTDDEVLIRTQSREVIREEIVQKTPTGQVNSPVPKGALPGPLTANTCRLEHPSTTHIADAIVCTGLTVFHPHHAINLSDFPSIVRRIVERQNSEAKPSTR
jgi:hypothetical protein